MHKLFISCDWGTSSFRLRIVDALKGKILSEVFTQQGISATFASWKEQQNADRFLFYRSYLETQINTLEKNYGNSLKNIPIIIAGMASSAIGMKELPYKQIPFTIEAQNLAIETIPATTSFPHKIILISGVCSANDAMRGEETIIAGCELNAIWKKQLFILPGTHSKHVIAEGGILTGFKTFMTGELFELISTKSILSASVEKYKGLVEENEAFIQGVKDAGASSLLNNIFHVRTNAIFNRMNKEDNYAYLSGLLIGEELKHIPGETINAVTIVSSGSLLKLYYKALQSLNTSYPLHIIDAGQALIRAQINLFNIHS